VYGPGPQFLAGARFAEDQHRGIRGGHFGDQAAHAFHGRRRADQFGATFEPIEPLLQGAVLVCKFAFFGHAVEHGFQGLQLAGFREIVERAVAQGGDGRVERRLAGEHDGLGVGRELFGFGDHADAVHAGHVEIDEDAVVGVAFQGGHGGEAVGANGHFVPHARQLEAHQLLERLFVVGEQEFQTLMRLWRVDGESPSAGPRAANVRGTSRPGRGPRWRP